MKNKHNKTYRGHLTSFKRQRAILKLKLSLLLLALIAGASAIGGAWANATLADYSSPEINLNFLKEQRRIRELSKQIKAVDLGKSGVIREVTMYTSSPEETDSSPCVSADGTNICEVDYNVCATNSFKFGTKLYVDKLGECIVKDRMNKRFSQRIDWYAGMDKERAINFGLQNLLVTNL